MRDWRRLIDARLSTQRLSPEAVDELAQHLEDTYQAELARSRNEHTAMRAVDDELASLAKARENLDIRTPRFSVIEQCRQFIQIDLRDAMRRLRRSPGFTAVAIGVLAVGLGVNTAIFSLINSVLFKPLPVRAPNELVFLYYFSNGYYGGVPAALHEKLAANTGMFRQLAAAGGDAAWVKIDGQTERLTGTTVSDGYFDTLGVSAQIGRTFTAGEDSAGASPTLVISNNFWTTHFNRDLEILGRKLRLSPDHSLTEASGRDYTVIGVLPAGFNGTGSAASWLSPSYYVPMHQRSIDSACVRPDGKQNPGRLLPVYLLGRLAEGVKFETAADFIAQSGKGWEREWWTDRYTPPAGSHFEIRQTRYSRLPVDSAGKIVPERLATALIIVSGLVLLIAASNLIGIFMARGITSRTDTAIRLSLGAGRWRVARQHLTEGYLLAFIGSGAGLIVAGALTRLFLAVLPSQFGSGVSTATPVSVEVAFDLRVLLFSLVTCGIVGTVIGLGPARQASRTDVLSALQLSAATSVKSRKGLRHWIVVPQIAVALVLLLVTGAVSRAVIVSEMADPGYTPDGLVSVQFQVPGADWCAGDPDYREWRRRREDLVRKIRNQLPALSAIESGAVSSLLPHDSMLGGSVITQEGFSTGQHYGVRLFDVSPDYFETMKIPIVAGRGFTDADLQTGSVMEPGALIISRKLAQALWPDQNPVGRLLAKHYPESKAPARWSEVVGVADDVLSALNDGYPAPAVYSTSSGGDRVIARAKASEADAIRQITEAIRSADPSVVVVTAGTVSDGIRQLRFSRRLAITILGSAALIGLALAAIGLYGVISYALSQRIREFGIRAALGAGYGDLVGLVFKEALLVATIGSVLGVAAAYSAVGLISSRLVAIPSISAAIVVGGPAIVFAIVALACYLPARRAANVDPMIVLRGL